MKQSKQVAEELQNSVKEQPLRGEYVKADMNVIRFDKTDILRISGTDEGEPDPFAIKL